jgi:hypothetical protein
MTTGLKDKNIWTPRQYHCRPLLFVGHQAAIKQLPTRTFTTKFLPRLRIQKKKVFCQNIQSCRAVIPANAFLSRNNVWPLETGYLRKATQQEREAIKYGVQLNYKGNKLAKVLLVGQVAFGGCRR